MSFRYNAHGTYVCDGCETKQFGYDDEMPNGWRESVTVGHPMDYKTDRVRHYCPNCEPPKEAPRG